MSRRVIPVGFSPSVWLSRTLKRSKRESWPFTEEEDEQDLSFYNEKSSLGEVQANFQFADPNATDFDEIKNLLKNYLCDENWDLNSFVQLIREQTTAGTVLKVTLDKDDSLLSVAVVTALNWARYEETRCFRELKDYLIKVCPEQKVNDLKVLLETNAKDVGLLVVSERLKNVPPQLLHQLYDGFFRDVSLATEDKTTEELGGSYLLVTKIYKNSVQTGETLFLKPEDEHLLQLSSWSFTFPMDSHLAAASVPTKDPRLMGLVMVVEARRIAEFIPMLNIVILKSKEGEDFEFNVEDVGEWILSFLQDSDARDYNGSSMKLEVPSTYLREIQLYYRKLRQANVNDTHDKFRTWESRHFVEMQPSSLLQLTKYTGSLGEGKLRAVCCRALADKLRGKPLGDIRREFGLVNDFTREQHLDVLRQNFWALTVGDKRFFDEETKRYR